MDAGAVADRTDHFSVSSRGVGFGPTVDLFGGGYVDSVGLVELPEFIHDGFGVAIADDGPPPDDVCRRAGSLT
jgi:hypothetical protein